MQYIVFIHNNADSAPAPDEWTRFIAAAEITGMFQGGSAIGTRRTVGQKPVTDTTTSVVGYMRFDSNDLSQLTTLLQEHPVVEHGGTIELCELTTS